MATNASPSSTSGATNARSTENDWLFDYIVQFLKSPPWTVPLNNFIDEVRCDDNSWHVLPCL